MADNVTTLVPIGSKENNTAHRINDAAFEILAEDFPDDQQGGLNALACAISELSLKAAQLTDSPQHSLEVIIQDIRNTFKINMRSK